ncbi:Uncharacterised protein [Rodentibacter pneumotropicus]|uniref:Uncharacterized protein n=1 Tax=Rodentibacter pneumotropicus TaxID=758 RepID=A0A3S5ERW0_9PAST|nr:Uncharacterised protein [Rodentibacter pneumotropicus]
MESCKAILFYNLKGRNKDDDISLFLGLCCLFSCLNAVATDPFDRSQRQTGENKMNLPKIRKENVFLMSLPLP